MIPFETAAVLAPYLLSLLEAGLEIAAPKVAAEAKKLLPTLEEIARIVAQLGDPGAVRAKLVELQLDAIDRAVDADLAAGAG